MTLALPMPLDLDGTWDFKGSNTQYSTHGIHTYVAAMIPQVARRLIDQYAPPGGTILDPFCGGGSVLVEAVSSGRPTIGRDVNELAVLISRAKTTHVDESMANGIADEIISGMEPPSEVPEFDDNTRFWFKAEHLVPLYTLRQSITERVYPDSPLLSFFLTVYSATVRDVSLTYRNEIRLRRMSPIEIDKSNVDPIQRFRERVGRASHATSSLPKGADTDIATGTVRALPLRDDEVSTIVCSPPYGDERNGVSYSQFSKNMLRWLGHSRDRILRSKELSLGWGRRERVAPSSPTLDRALSAMSEFPSSIQEAIAFYADYQAGLEEMVRVTKGLIVIVIGQRVLRDTILDNGAITTELMQNIGVPLIDIFYRKLPSKRLPKMRKFGAAINRETILVFQK